MAAGTGPGRRRGTALIAAAGALALAGCQSGIGPDPERPRATIAAYETEVADLRDLADGRQATIMALTPPPATPPPPLLSERWRIEVVGPVERRPEVGRRDGLTPVAAEGVFLVVPIAVTNLTGEPASFAPDRIRAVDGEGRVFDLASRAAGAAYLLDLRYDPSFAPRQPGIAYPDVLVFDLPADAQQLALEATDGSLYVPLEPVAAGTPAS